MGGYIMRIDIFEENYQNSIQIIESMTLSEKNKKQLLKIMDNLRYEYNRSSNCYEENIKVLEEEKKILLKHFMKKDEDANYLYMKVQQYETNFLNRMFRRFRKNVK